MSVGIAHLIINSPYEESAKYKTRLHWASLSLPINQEAVWKLFL